ncbi:cysteine proteinase [Apiospora arundinis]|uniref:ubiquitinyl hydrolase 1 n=1 Tax=Apiospora arundinis TaxID=335852 RepID=A0ABR2HZU4_9PEZI
MKRTTRKLLSRRDKDKDKDKDKTASKSSDSTHKYRPLSSEIFRSIFKSDSKRRSENDEEKPEDPEKEAAKVQEVLKRLGELGIKNAEEEHVLYALHYKCSAGNVEKAVELMCLQQKALAGELVPYNPNVQMLGAENRGNVTCYLDALLFAMFAKVEAFECMLKKDLPEDPQTKLAALLRLWVNMLRSGKLIQSDMTEHIQNALAACGWNDAKLLEQQDTSEAFAFITETLQLPLLPLQVDLFHQGKNDEADHKVVYERLLNLAVPDAEGKEVKLEDCLEEYFNSQVDVHRDDLEESKTTRRVTLTPTPRASTVQAAPSTPLSTIRLVSNGDDEGTSGGSSGTDEEEGHDHSTPLERRWTERPSTATSVESHTRPQRSRTESLIQRVVLDEQAKSTDGADNASLFARAKRTASVVKAVTIPAWQFFRLIPWHSTSDAQEPQNDLEVARHFSQRPVVGICLKRYMVDENGVPKRQNTFIDIPDSLRLPHFIVDDRHVEENGLSTDYKLVLQSVVCHRGDSLHSGHYISFVRVAPKLLTDNRRHDSDPPPDYEEAQWVLFDDLSYENRVSTVDDIKQSLKDEMPYLLFYQIVPIVDVTASSTDGTDAEPPSYDDSAVALKTAGTATPNLERLSLSRQASSYFENISALASTSASIRFSADIDRPIRRSFADDDGYLNVSRRGSLGNELSSLSLGPSPAVTPIEENSPNSPAATPSDETTAQRLSRAAAKFRTGSKSRPGSQAGENRISLTMSRLSGLVRTSKEPLRENAVVDTDEDFEVVLDANGTTTNLKEKEKEDQKDKDKDKEKEKEKDKDKDKDKDKESGHKRGRSKARLDKGKGKEKESKGKQRDVPERECALM